MVGKRRSFWSRLVGPARPVVPVIRLSGVIGVSNPLRPTLTLEGVTRQIDTAFAMKSAPAVAIAINSPGGSPVQSHLIYRRIRTLAEEKKKPVIAFLEDVAASGGYMIALAGDEIIADPNSIVGSIGVVSAGFGFTGLIERLGIERRVHTSGRQKAMLDPFLPEKPDEVEHLKALQAEVHTSFVRLVRSRRPALAEGEDLFTGAFWTGARALGYGLVDGLGDLRSVLRERFGDDLRLRVLGEKRGFLRRRLGLGPRSAAPDLAAGSVDAIISVLEERSLWSRFGL